VEAFVFYYNKVQKGPPDHIGHFLNFPSNATTNGGQRCCLYMRHQALCKGSTISSRVSETVPEPLIATALIAGLLEAIGLLQILATIFVS